MEAITSIPPSASMPSVASRQAKSGQSQAKPVVQSSEKAGKLEVKPEAKPGVKPEAAVSEEQLKQALEQLNKQFASEGIGFVYEERLNQLFVQIKDKATGEVVKEFPPKSAISHMVAMKELAGLILDRQA